MEAHLKVEFPNGSIGIYRTISLHPQDIGHNKIDVHLQLVAVSAGGNTVDAYTGDKIDGRKLKLPKFKSPRGLVQNKYLQRLFAEKESDVTEALTSLRQNAASV